MRGIKLLGRVSYVDRVAYESIAKAGQYRC